MSLKDKENNTNLNKKDEKESKKVKKFNGIVRVGKTPKLDSDEYELSSAQAVAILNDLEKEKSEDISGSDEVKGSDLPYENHYAYPKNINATIVTPSDKVDVKELENKILSKLSEKELLDSKIEILENKLGLAITENLKSKRKLELIKLELVENYKKLMKLDHGEDKELDTQALINSFSSLWPTNL